MTTQTITDTGTRAAVLPRVNLLPPEIAENRRFRRVRIGLGGVVVAAAGVVGLLYLDASNRVEAAQERLDATRAQTAALRRDSARYRHVPPVYARVAASEAMLSQAMGKEIRWSYYLNDLSASIPSHVWLTQVQVTQDVDAAASTGNRAPGGQQGNVPMTAQGIGQITFRGTAYRHNDVAVWLETVAKQKGYTGPSFSNSTERYIDSRKVVDFTSTVTLTDQALSGRYTTKPAGS